MNKNKLGTSTNSLANATAGFYNSICTALNLDPTQYQMVQGAFPVPSGSVTELYNYLDGVPPVSDVVFYTGNPLVKQSGNYLNLLASQATSFPQQLAMNAFNNAANWVGGVPGSNPVYSPSQHELLNALGHGAAASFTFDSNSEDTSLLTSWAQNASSAGVYFWGTNSDSTAQRLNATAAVSRVTVAVTIDSFATVAVQPGPWFMSSEFISAYENPNTWTTGPGTVTWQSEFGSTGSWQHSPTTVVVVNGYTLTIQSFGCYIQSDVDYINNSKNVNVFPFYTSKSSTATSSTVLNTRDNSITTTVTVLPGNIQILGFLVSSTASLVG